MPSDPGGGTILIIEDDADIRDFMAEALADEGHAVATAQDGQDALVWLGNNPAPRLIILDLWMPTMGGEEFRREQLKDPSLASIPVVLLTGVHDGQRWAVTLGTQGYLPKPISLQRLMALASHHR